MTSQTEIKADPPQDDQFLNAMKKGDSGEDLKKAFNILSKDQINATVSADVLRLAMESVGLKLTKEEVEEKIRQVKADDKDQVQINCEEFIKIINLLKNPTVADQLTNIYGLLCREEKETGKVVVLYGQSGVGKTWMAKKTADRAVRQGIFDIALWIYPNRKLEESVIYQLSIVLSPDESKAKEEANKDGKEEEEEDDKSKKDKLEEEKRKKQELERKILEKLEKKRVLLVFDEGSRMTVQAVLSEGSASYNLLAIKSWKYYKVLRTSSVNELCPDEFGIMVRPLTRDDPCSKSLVDRVGGSEERDLAEFFIDKIDRLPSEVLIIAKMVRDIGQSDSGLQKLQSVKEMLLENELCNVIQLLINECDLLPRSVLIDCFNSETSEKHFLSQLKIVNYNELISYWIMEGHLGQFDCIEDAYEEGHRVFMYLVECGLLKKVEAGYVVSSGRKFDFDIHERCKFYGEIQLGLATTFDSNLGSIAPADGMIRTISSGHGSNKLLTLLLDGNRFGEVRHSSFESNEKTENLAIFNFLRFGEVSHSLFESYSEIENLVIFNPTHKPFPLPIFKMRNLHLLILRGCEYFESIADPEKQQVPEGSVQETSNLQHSQSLPLLQFSDPDPSHSSHLNSPATFLQLLTALEISGPCSLKTIPDHVFKSMPELRNLNLSFLQFELLPESFYHLTKLEILILRGCSSLKELETLKNFKNLEVLDLSGSTSLENLRDKSFSENRELQIVDLSKTRLEKFPLVRSNEKLKSVSLRDCPALVRIRKINLLEHLQVFNISGSKKVEQFLDPSLERLKSCKVLDASRTSIKRLPFNIGKVRDLYLRQCCLLKELTPFEAVSDVEVLDASGSSHLEDIKGDFFNKVQHLRELNLSKTGVKKLPSLSPLGKLRRLLLSNCEALEKLEELNSLKELEVLDLSGCGALKEIESFDNMKRLHTLDLSEIQLDQLPSLQDLTNLRKLYVRDCPRLTNLPGLEELHLEILDHSGTTLEPPPSFNHPDHPHVIGPSPLSSNFVPQELLKDLGCKEQHIKDDGGEKSDLPREKLDRCYWSISNWQPETNVSEENLGEPVKGARFIQLLKEYPSLLSKNFREFHFCVFPTAAQTDLPDKASYRDELSLRDIYFGQVSPGKPGKCLEIRGFRDCPLLPQHLVEQAAFVVLINNPFLRLLSDLYVDSIMAMKACWIEGCNDMEHVSGEKSNDNLKNLEVLWVSDAMKLGSISSKEIQGFSFTSLKSLCLEYCPQLSVICFSSLQLENLEILFIRYCQKLRALFEDESARLDKLTKLTLWGLPELKQISCKLESLCLLTVGQCPLLEHVLSSTQGEENEFEGHVKLEILQIKFCDKLKSIIGSQHEEEPPYLPELQELELWALPDLQKIAFNGTSLQSLKVGECPSLENVVDSEEVHKKLKVLEVKSCEKVKKIVEGNDITFGELDKLELVSLPELKSIGGNQFPCLKKEKCLIYGCPKLRGTLKLQEPVEGEPRAESSRNDARNP